MAEGTSLLRMHTAYTCIVGSNPTVSARIKQKSLPCGRLFCLSGRNGGIRRIGQCRPNPLRIAQSPRCAARWPRSGQRRSLISGNGSQHIRRLLRTHAPTCVPQTVSSPSFLPSSLKNCIICKCRAEISYWPARPMSAALTAWLGQARGYAHAAASPTCQKEIYKIANMCDWMACRRYFSAAIDFPLEQEQI